MYVARPPPSLQRIRSSARLRWAAQGGFDYVVADAVGRRLYIPAPDGATGRVTVFDLDTLKSIGEIPDTNGARGVAIDPKSHHGISSSKPVVMFDTGSLKTIKSIDVEGSPDGILFEPSTAQDLRFSHRAECDCNQCGRRFRGGND